MKRFHAFFLFAVLLFFVSTANANISYTVKSGDSLYKISKKFDVPESEIKKTNNLKSSKLSVGVKLIIPQKDKTAKDSNKKNHADKNKVYHTVKKGDTLKKIAMQYSISEKKLKEINNLKTNKLKAGQKILVKDSSSNIEDSRKAFYKEESADNAARGKIYIVKKGDSIWRIAKKFDISVEELKDINGLTGNSLKRGQKLVVSKAAMESNEPEDIKTIQASYDRKASPIITSTKLEEIKELSNSNDLSKMSIKERIILFAKKMLHMPYRFGGNGSFGLDCSAYVQKVFSIAGINLPRSAREQFNMGETVDKENLTAGDLVFFRTYASFPSHVGIYLGNNLFIHASTRSKKVTIDSLERPYYLKRFIGAKRLIPEEEIKTKEAINKEN